LYEGVTEIDLNNKFRNDIFQLLALYKRTNGMMNWDGCGKKLSGTNLAVLRETTKNSSK
jgi:hypothetical protein